MDIKEIKSVLKKRVAKGLNFGIESFEELVDESSDIFNDFILIQSKYNDLMYLSSMNTMPYDQIEIGLDRIRANMLGLINKIDSDSLEKQEVKSDLKVNALPTRRTNFFKLLDIHFMNLEGVRFIEVYYGDTDRVITGRPGVFEFYQLHRRQLKGMEESGEEEQLAAIKAYFFNLFSNEMGSFEVYFKNIKHLLHYTLQSEIEQGFFIDTLKSLFSRFELAMIFYYSISGMDEELLHLIKKSKLIDLDLINPILIDAEKINYKNLL